MSTGKEAITIGVAELALRQFLDPTGSEEPPSSVLIAGSRIEAGKVSRAMLYPGSRCVGVDMRPGHGVDIVADLQDATALRGLGWACNMFPHVDCTSVLEHATKPWDLARNLEDLTQVGGSLFIQVPWMWRFHGYPGDYWRFTPSGIRLLFPHVDFTVQFLVSNGVRVDKKSPNHYTFHDRKVFFEKTEVVMIGRKK